MKQQRAFYEHYWQERESGWSPRGIAPDAQVRRLISSFVSPGQWVLDYGCGDCAKCGALVRSRGAHYVGCDISLPALRTCSQRYYDVVAHSENVGALPFAEETFDVVVCLEVLEHLVRPDHALHTVLGTLKPGGTLIVSVPNVAWIGHRMLMLAGFFNPGGSPETSFRAPWRDPHLRFFSKNTLLRLLCDEAGLEILICTGTDFDLAELPLFFKTPWVKPLIRRIGVPLRKLGRRWPALFAGTLFAVARKR